MQVKILFEIYYSSLASVTTNNIDISDRSVSKKSLKLDKSYDENSYVYLRLINSNEFEYVVAKSVDNANKGNYLNEIKKGRNMSEIKQDELLVSILEKKTL